MLVVALWQCMWGKGWGGAMVLAPLSAGFQSLPLLPTIKLGPSGADSRVGELVHALGSCGSLQWTLLWGWEFPVAASTPMGVFNQRSEALFPHTGLCSLLWFPAVPSSLSVCECGAAASAHLTGSTSHCLAASPLRPGCPSPPLLPVWMNAYFLFPWCWTSWLFNFLSVLVVRGGAVCLPTPPSWFSPPCFSSYIQIYECIFLSPINSH